MRSPSWLVASILVLGCSTSETEGWSTSASSSASSSSSSGVGGHGEYDIRVDASHDLPPTTLNQGFLHGVKSGAAPDVVSRIKALKPTAWRVSNLYGTYDLIVSSGLTALGPTKVEVNLNDYFSDTYGYPVVVDPKCDPKTGPRCIPDYATLKSGWSAFVEDFMGKVDKANPTIDYFDLFSEPDWSWKGIDIVQFADLIKIAHDIIRKHRPTAKIVAPSASLYSLAGLKDLFQRLAALDVHIDAIAWHEFTTPFDVPGNIAAVRAAMKTVFAKKPELMPTEIQINEYAPPQAHLVPGWTAAYLFSFEAAGVDFAVRACWNAAPGWSDCESGLNGLLTKNNAQPQAVYWVHEAYGNMPRTRLSVENHLKDVVAIASHDAATQEVRVLLGRASCGADGAWCKPGDSPVAAAPNAPIALRLGVVGYMPNATSVHVGVRSIAPEGKPVALPMPSDAPDQVIAISQGEVDIPMPKIEDGAAYLIVVKP
jgi:hypothetical protein